jgi:hypothetical protein
MNLAAFILLICALLTGGGVFFGFPSTNTLIPAILLGAAMVLALLNVVAQSDTTRGVYPATSH